VANNFIVTILLFTKHLTCLARYYTKPQKKQLVIQFLYQTTCTEKLLTPFTIQKKFHSELHIFEVIETRNSAPGAYFTDPYARNLLHEVLELHFRGQTLHQRKIAHQTHVLQCKFVHQKPFYAKQLHLTPQATS